MAIAPPSAAGVKNSDDIVRRLTPAAVTLLAVEVDIGSATETEVAEFVEFAFGADFVFRSPKHRDSRVLKETSDLLIMWDDVAIAVECKSQAINADGSSRVQDRGWTTRNLKKALSQLRGALKTIKGCGIVNLENERRGQVRFDVSTFKFVYALVVTNEVSPPYSIADVVPEISKFPGAVHVVSFRDFCNLCRCLDTPADLVNYFEMRTDVLIPTFAPRVHEEQKVFSAFEDRFEELHAFRSKLCGAERNELLFRPSGEVLRAIYRDEIHDDSVARSHYIDEIVDAAHDVDPTISDSAGYIEVATYLGGIPRARRIQYADEFLAAIDRTKRSGENALAHFSSELRSECLLFIASCRPRTERAIRIRELVYHTALLRVTRGVRRAVGIATDVSSSSFDFTVVEGEAGVDPRFPDIDEARADGNIVFGNVTQRTLNGP